MNANVENKKFWAVIPAAGVGSRMQADRPKQYLQLHDKTVLEHSLQRLLDHPSISGAVISLDANDAYWQDINFKHEKPLMVVDGGKERCDSVLNALHGLKKELNASQDVWVLVHDAARPCVRRNDLTKLIEMASTEDDGGLLACPVRDTIKKQKQGSANVDVTVDRSGLWHALTPQMFKLELLINALEKAASQKQHVTDDASAMELAGYHPKLVEGHEDNLKITRPFDLSLAELYIQNQQ